MGRKVIGYARTSTVGQNLESQMVALHEAGCDEIITDKATGKNTDRPGFTRMMDHLRADDIVVVTKLDRLSRSTADLLKTVGAIEEKGAALRVLDNPALDTTTAAGRMMFTVFAAFAEFELNIRAERQAAGIAVAKAKGVYRGRKKTLTDAEIRELRHAVAAGRAPVERIAKQFGISRPTAYRYLKD